MTRPVNIPKQRATSFAIPVSEILTIDTGAITITGSNHRVDTESAVALDQLTQINGGSEGDLLILRTVNNARAVACVEGGNLIQNTGTFTISNVNDRIVYQYDGTNWVELSRSDNDA